MNIRATRDRVRRCLPAALLLAAALGVQGCSGTRVIDSNPRIVPESDSAALVYFIRPNPERYMGYPDNTITIYADGEELLDLVKGEYTLVSLRPGTVVLTVYSDTNWGPDFLYKEMVRSRELELDPGQTYFIAMIPVDGEFRGVYFNFESVDLPRARELAHHLWVTGDANSRPIDSL